MIKYTFLQNTSLVFSLLYIFLKGQDVEQKNINLYKPEVDDHDEIYVLTTH